MAGLGATQRVVREFGLGLPKAPRTPYINQVSPLRARVENGRLVLDEPTSLPEGTIIDLVADDDGDDLTDEERRALHETLSASWRSAQAGKLRPADAVLDEMRRRR